MLGKEDRQISFFDTGFACSHLIDKKSFYAKMRECANKIIIDTVFKKTLELARKAGLLKKKVDQVIDSTPMLGAGAAKDT